MKGSQVCLYHLNLNVATELRTDFVRLHASLAPPHWKRDNIPDKWDAGYQNTAYFLDWLDERYASNYLEFKAL